MEKKLSDRKHDILCNLIDDYIKDASPVTSGGIKEKHELEVSTATLRNELNALEEMGYLKQVHTSGGRVPTTEGYRYYVNSLLKDLKADDKKLEQVKVALTQKTSSVTDVISEIAKIISTATNYPTVVVMNGYDKLIVESILLFSVIQGKALVIIKTTSGIINNSIDVKADQKDLDDASKILTAHFMGKTIKFMIDNMDKIEDQMKKEISSFKIIVDSLITGLKKVAEQNSVNVRTGGASKFLELNEKKSVEDAKNLLSLLEDEDELANVLAPKDNEKDVSVVVSDDDDSLSGCSMIRAPIKVGGETVGSVGVIGPKRMDYLKIASALKYVVNEISVQNELNEGDNNV